MNSPIRWPLSRPTEEECALRGLRYITPPPTPSRSGRRMGARHGPASRGRATKCRQLSTGALINPHCLTKRLLISRPRWRRKFVLGKQSSWRGTPSRTTPHRTQNLAHCGNPPQIQTIPINPGLVLSLALGARKGTPVCQLDDSEVGPKRCDRPARSFFVSHDTCLRGNGG